jgi:hypothetical protein
MKEKQVNELISRLVDGAGEKTRNLIVDMALQLELARLVQTDEPRYKTNRDGTMGNLEEIEVKISMPRVVLDAMQNVAKDTAQFNQKGDVDEVFESLVNNYFRRGVFLAFPRPDVDAVKDFATINGKDRAV